MRKSPRYIYLKCHRPVSTTETLLKKICRRHREASLLPALPAEIKTCPAQQTCSPCGNRSLSTPRFLFFLTTFILPYANCSLPIRNIPVRGSAQVPSALASEPEQIIPTHRAAKSSTVTCQQCSAGRESVHHFLITCPAYIRQRNNPLARYKLGTQAHHVKYLLNDPKRLKALFQFIATTHRFKAVFGDVSPARNSNEEDKE